MHSILRDENGKYILYCFIVLWQGYNYLRCYIIVAKFLYKSPHKEWGADVTKSADLTLSQIYNAIKLT